MPKSFDVEAILAKLGGIEPSVGDEFDPLTALDVRQIEKAVGAKLPKLLQQILTSYGSFSFKNYVFYTPTVKFPKSYSKWNRGIVGMLLGKVNPKYPRARAISILRTLDMLDDVLPAKYLPIAEDGMGDVVCLSLARKNAGVIFLWNHEGRTGEDWYLVNDSLEGWLRSLTAGESK